MIRIFTPSFRNRRSRLASSIAPPPPGEPPVLVAAEVRPLGDSMGLAMTFDREVDRSAIDLEAFTIDDGAGTGDSYVAIGVYEGSPANEVILFLESAGPTPGDQSYFSATNANGIVSASDGAAWPGAQTVEVPFGE